MKQLLGKWNSLSLMVRISIGLILGLLLGMTLPSVAVISLLGEVFVGALKAIAPVLVFFLIISSLANAGKGLGPQFRTVIVLYLLSTLLAAVVAVFVSFLFPIKLQLTEAASSYAPSGIWEVLNNLILNIVQNPVAALLNANYIAILFWAVVFGLGLKKIGSDSTKKVFSDLSDVVSQVVRGIIQMAPFGIMGLVYTTVSAHGLSTFAVYGKTLAVLVGTMFFVALVINPLITGICLRKNPYPLVLRCLKDSGLTALFTRSSAANIPVNMQLCEKLGLDKESYSISIPLGATINMDGAAVTITILTLAAANTVGVTVDLPSAIILSIMATFAACGASGVAGGSLLLIPMACSLFGIGSDIAMQVVGVGFIIGVIQDSVETALNSSGDVLFTATAEYMQWKKEGRPVDFHWKK